MAKKIDFNQEIKDRIIELLEKGCTDRDIYKSLKVSHTTYYKWTQSDIAFLETIKQVKRPLNIEVEASLFKSANGYKYKEVTKELNPVTGKMIKTKEVTRDVPPNPTSMIFWLKNKDHENWKDKREVEIPGGINLIVTKDDENLS